MHIIRCFFFIFSITILACQQGTEQASGFAFVHPDYKVLFEQLAADNGLPIRNMQCYQNKSRQLCFIGVQHTNNVQDTIFDFIEQQVRSFKPQLIIHEGGQMNLSQTLLSKEEEIRKQGELGLIRYLGIKEKMALVNGDGNEMDEHVYLRTSFSEDTILYFYSSQRFVEPFLRKNDSLELLEKKYSQFVEEYLVARCGFSLREDQKKWSYFVSLWSKFNQTKFDWDVFEQHAENYVNSDELIGQLGRSSLRFRDSTLCATVFNAMKENKRILIVFGALHSYSCRPTLMEMLR